MLEYARKQNVTKIIAGKTAQPWWKQLVRRTVVEELLARSGEIDIYVITGEDIRRSGVTSIPEALRLAPGVEVARISS